MTTHLRVRSLESLDVEVIGPVAMLEHIERILADAGAWPERGESLADAVMGVLDDRDRVERQLRESCEMARLAELELCGLRIDMNRRIVDTVRNALADEARICAEERAKLVAWLKVRYGARGRECMYNEGLQDECGDIIDAITNNKYNALPKSAPAVDVEQPNTQPLPVETPAGRSGDARDQSDSATGSTAAVHGDAGSSDNLISSVIATLSSEDLAALARFVNLLRSRGATR